MEVNQEKCHLSVSGHKYENFWVRIGQWEIWKSMKQKLRG